ncbi:class I SAM-dependent methyltransferase [Granulicella sp. S190]|uniref:class I SAM-dependent methyltransferase n=1 Tax=Granulicella sp. S190 TaxID=1747226 RepID=UPI00131A7E33|nr:class I SAM-dependent methyltransferase [Granulicella sp. S190]
MPDQPNFDFIARPYRSLEYLTLGRALERCRLHFLPNLIQQRRALVLGDGDGRFLAELFVQNPQLVADAIDTSATMLQLLRQRCEARAPESSSRLTTCQTSALLCPLGKSYDLVITHFFLDCLNQSDLENLVNRITPRLSTGALWLISDFHIPQGLMHLPAKLMVRSLYLAFRILAGLRTTQLPDHVTPIRQAGFNRVAQQNRLFGLLTTELWQFNPAS